MFIFLDFVNLSQREETKEEKNNKAMNRMINFQK